MMARQLTSVYDSTLNVQGFPYKASGTYTYDPNGNLLIDPYQGITMTYDVLNRTDSTKINGTTYITYTYDVSGSLIRKKAYNSGTLTQTDYIDGFVYTGNGTSQTLAYAPMPEGRLLGTSLTQEYVITDPQGNARVAFQNNGGMAKVTQENSYYGYGLMMPGSLVGFSSPPNKNLYNGGSEWQNDTKAVNAGVPDYYQTFYRNYDPAIARFVSVDPEAEGAESMSDYHYAGDNPIVYNDPGGNKAANANAWAYIEQGYAEQAMYQNMYQGSIGGGGIAVPAADSSPTTTSDVDASLEQTNVAASDNFDPSGMQATVVGGDQPIETTIVNQNGTVTQINDGSNATFEYEGDGTFKFTGYTDQGGRNIINLQTLQYYAGAEVELAPVTITAAPIKKAPAWNETVTTLTYSPRIVTTSVYGQSTFSSYTGVVDGEEGRIGTANFKASNRGVSSGGKIGAVSYDFDLLNNDFSVSITLGRSTYGVGVTEDGFTYDSSVQNGIGIVGQTSSYRPGAASIGLVILYIIAPEEGIAEGITKLVTR